MQEDTQEFLSILLNALYLEIPDEGKMFGCTTTEVVTCADCQFPSSSTTIDQIYLTLNTQDCSSVQECLNNLKWQGGLQSYCRNCKKSVNKLKITTVHGEKMYLSLYLTRFTGDLKKSLQDIKVNLKLDLHKTQYCLKSIVLHTGNNISHGHYMALCRIGSEWWLFDDSSVSVTVL